MSPSQHAVLSPSAAHRWMTCPASIRMTDLVSTPVQSDSVWAAEGTVAHTVAELSARYYVLGSLSKKAFRSKVRKATKGWTEEQRHDMIRHGKAYAKYLAQRMRVHPHTVLLLEQRVQTGIDQCWGTSDAVLVSPEHVEIVDYKYGTGIWVYAEGNEQLMLYAVGALEQIADLLGDVELVRLGIFQPRLDHYDTWEIAASELRAWRDAAKPVAADALAGSDVFGPSEQACRFCPAAGECRPRMEAALVDDFGADPDLLQPDDISDILDRAQEIKNFLAAVEERALRLAYSEHVPLPRWKVVLSGGRRGIATQDVEEAAGILTQLGYDAEDIYDYPERKLKGIGALERLMGRGKFADFLGELAKPPPGRPSLAPEDDPRPAVSNLSEAQKEFGEPS